MVGVVIWETLFMFCFNHREDDHTWGSAHASGFVTLLLGELCNSCETMPLITSVSAMIAMWGCGMDSCMMLHVAKYERTLTQQSRHRNFWEFWEWISSIITLLRCGCQGVPTILSFGQVSSAAAGRPRPRGLSIAQRPHRGGGPRRRTHQRWRRSCRRSRYPRGAAQCCAQCWAARGGRSEGKLRSWSCSRRLLKGLKGRPADSEL